MMRKILGAALGATLVSALGFGAPAMARTPYEICVRECEGRARCERHCGEEYKPLQTQIPPSTLPKEPVPDWAKDIFNPANGGADGSGGSGR